PGRGRVLCRSGVSVAPAWLHQMVLAESLRRGRRLGSRPSAPRGGGPASWANLPRRAGGLDGRAAAGSGRAARGMAPSRRARRPAAEWVKGAPVWILPAGRPLLVLGSAAAGAAPLARALAEALEMPVVSADRTDLSILPYPVSDARYLGQYGEESEALRECDCVVAIGCRLFFPFSDSTWPRLPANARVVHVDPE